MWNLNDDVVFIMNFDAFVLKTIINVMWNTKIFFIFSLIQIMFAKSFENLRTRFSLTMLISSMRKFIFFEINTFKNVFSISRNLFDNFDEWKQKKLFLWKKKYFLFLIICFFEKKKSFFILYRDISSRYFDCHKNVNRQFWFKFKRWCIIKCKQLKFF
jgi:hypothetical protein